MNNTAILTCLSQILTDLQLKICLLNTRVTDLTWRQIFNDTSTSFGHCQLAITEYQRQHNFSTTTPADTTQIQAIIKRLSAKN